MSRVAAASLRRMFSNKVSGLVALDQLPEAKLALAEGLAMAERTSAQRFLVLQATAGIVHFFAREWDDAVAELESLVSAGAELAAVEMLPYRVRSRRRQSSWTQVSSARRNV